MKSDRWIRKHGPQIFSSFVPSQINFDPMSNENLISYGLSSTGYDIRLAREFKVPIKGMVLNPKHADESKWDNIVTDTFVMPPHSFALGHSVEFIRMPHNVTGLCQGKSTYARNGIIVPVTPLEPGWEGHLTIELVNVTDNEVYVYPYEGICQVTFFKPKRRPMVTYADRHGKYQNQTGVTLGRA